MILKIVKYPEPVLSQPGEPVTEFNDELRKFVADMFETMYAAQGIGLAAPQVAVSKRVTVIDLSMGKDSRQKLVLINPEVTFRDGKQYEEEGCLSFPDIREKVQRAFKVTIRAQNEHGKWFEMDGEELLSRGVASAALRGISWRIWKDRKGGRDGWIACRKPFARMRSAVQDCGAFPVGSDGRVAR